MSRINPITRIDAHLFKIYSNSVLLSTPSLPKGLFPAGIPIKILKVLLPSFILNTWPAHLYLLELITLTILRERNKLWSSPSLPRSFQIICRVPRPFVMLLNKGGFYNMRLLASRQTPKMKDHSWSALHDGLFNIFPANLHIWRPTPPSAIQGTRHVVVTGTHGWIEKY